MTWAQSNANKGQILGTVYDPNQAVIAGAKVNLRNVRTGFTRDLTTDAQGQYRAVLLDPGEYQISAESSGFAINKVEGVELTVGASINVDIVLQVQATVTTVEVGASLINVALPAPATTLNLNALTNLPINGRRFQDFAVLTPTVQVDPQRQQLSFAGQRGIYSNVMLDGADYNQPFFGGIRGGERSNSVITVPQSAIQEFQVITTGYSAEYGRSTGGVLNTITKSGGNDIHGDAFYQMRHKEFGAKDPVQMIASNETLQQFGGSIGGPIKKEKLFFFGAVERQLSRTPRSVLFASLLNIVPTPATREAYDFFKSEEKGFRQTNDAVGATARADYQTAAGNRLTLRYNFSDANADNAVSAGASIGPFTNRAFSNDGVEKDRTHTGTAQYTHLFSPSVLNDLRFSGSYEIRPRLANSATPQVDVRTIGYFGARNFLPTTQDDTRWQISDALSVTSGRHTFKFGVDYNKVTAAQAFGFNQFGAFNVASSNVNELLDILGTGGTVANRFDSRTVTYLRQIGNLEASLGMHQIAAFAQDSWRIGQKLTIDLGLRWEGQLNPQPEANNEFLLRQVQGVRFPNGAFIDPSKINNSNKQIMPRFGFAWMPAGGSRRTVVRGHTGMFYASTPLLVMAGPANNFRNPPGDVSIQLSPTATQTVYQQLLAVGVDLNRSPLGQLPVIPVETVQRASALALGGVGANPFAGANLIAMAPDFTNPRSFQAGLGVETEVIYNFLLGVQLNYVNSIHLLRNRDYNLPAPGIRPTDQSQRPNFNLRSGGRRPITSLGSITARESSARSMYRGATFSAQYRSKRYQFGAHYTLSENFSDDDSERDATGFNYDNAFNLANDYGYSRIDVRHLFAGYFVVSLPWRMDVSAAVNGSSGRPVNPLTGTDSNEDLFSNDRPYQSAGKLLERNSFRNRAVWNNNLRVLKSFGGEVRKVQLSFEFFNLLNIDNVLYSGPNGGLFGGTYGPGFQPNGVTAPVDPRFLRLKLADGSYDRNNAQSGSPFQMQVGLRFFF
jgi:hypothetical protein